MPEIADADRRTFEHVRNTPVVRTLFRQRTTGVALLTLDGRYVAANPTLCVHRTEPGSAPLCCPHARHEHGGTICAPMIVQGEIVGLAHLRTDHATALRCGSAARSSGRRPRPCRCRRPRRAGR